MHFSCCGMIYPATACFFSPQKLSQQSRKGLFYPQTHSTQSPACCFIPLTAGKITHFSKKFPLIHTAPLFLSQNHRLLLLSLPLSQAYYYSLYLYISAVATTTVEIFSPGHHLGTPPAQWVCDSQDKSTFVSLWGIQNFLCLELWDARYIHYMSGTLILGTGCF